MYTIVKIFPYGKVRVEGHGNILCTFTLYMWDFHLAPWLFLKKYVSKITWHYSWQFSLFIPEVHLYFFHGQLLCYNLAHRIQQLIPKLQILNVHEFFNLSECFEWKKKTTASLDSYFGKTSWKFSIMVSGLVVGSGEQDIPFWQESERTRCFEIRTYVPTHCTAVPNCQTWCKSAQAGNYYSEAQAQAKVSFLGDCLTLIGMSYKSKINACL